MDGAYNDDQLRKITRQIGDNIRGIRGQQTRGGSQENFGDILGVTYQQIQKYEKGINRIGAAQLALLAAELGEPVSAFFKGITALNQPQGPYGDQARVCLVTGSARCAFADAGDEVARCLRALSQSKTKTSCFSENPPPVPSRQNDEEHLATQAATPKEKEKAYNTLIGRNIRRYRLSKRLTQGVLGKKTGVSYQAIQKYEAGQDAIPAARLVAIAVVLEVDVTQLFENLAARGLAHKTELPARPCAFTGASPIVLAGAQAVVIPTAP